MFKHWQSAWLQKPDVRLIKSKDNSKWNVSNTKIERKDRRTNVTDRHTEQKETQTDWKRERKRERDRGEEGSELWWEVVCAVLAFV